ncbi:MAG TPA: vWA domain-containing protein [Polyangiales bacterium]|nr:vWA domain-containing protein [Polyangiales bacterium]
MSRGRFLIGSAALLLQVACTSERAPHSPRTEPTSPTASPTAVEEAPEWLADEKRHRDEEGSLGKRKSRNRFGTEGPVEASGPHMSREAAREAAAKAGVLGILKQQAPAAPSGALGNDPMSALGQLMGDQLSANFGLGGLGLRGQGRSAPIADVATEQPERPRWRKREAVRRSSPLSAADAQPLAQLTGGDAGGDAPSLLRSHSSLQGVSFIDASGYFANSYVPGDPELRSLHARLRGYDRASVLPAELRAARLEDASKRVAQPFDAPGQAALAVYLSASERGITAPRRMLLQVGLSATPRYSGRRPTMNVGIVLDARTPLDAAAQTTVRALLTAFADARDPSDKLALYAAGPGGGKLVAPDEFRHGPLTVALDRLQSDRSGASVSLSDALSAALQSLRSNDDPNAPLGSSVAILIAPHALGRELARLESLAHDSAVDGLTVSAFGAGPDVSPDELSRIALAGQGNRRLLESPADAAPAVDRELSAVARVVARAVRLRIRLASGVRLVSVLGSHPLDEQRAQQVREAENSIDQRLRKNLGIAQDRGEDEEGVQIVIPSFYAGDAHVVLLDVVAEGPGPIADVSVRYKDLVQLENGTARESLWLPNLELARGALQRNVLKNLAAYELASHLRKAGDALASYPDTSSAQLELNQALAMLDDLAAKLPELRGDRELERDRALTREYLALLAHVAEPAQRQLATDSLHLASLFKLQPRPE